MSKENIQVYAFVVSGDVHVVFKNIIYEKQVVG